MKIISIVGARPNFMKIAPIIDAINRYNQDRKQADNPQIKSILVHTGQHYDAKMSRFFFDDLEIPKPDINLGVGSGSHAEQTAEIMKRFEPVLIKERPDYILVVGDVNSTIACALTASKLGIKIIHVEAGLRSFDRNMPEEINRVLTDALSDILFITEKGAEDNLNREGILSDKIYFVGNVMIDTLLKHVRKAEDSVILTTLGLLSKDGGQEKSEILPYAVLTLHRPSNVDDKKTLEGIIDGLSIISQNIPIIFPIHPRTMSKIDKFELGGHFNIFSNDITINKGIYLMEPLGYLDFLRLMSNSALVFTDSGGIQEETTVLGIPCITLRENTERPITVSCGTNYIAGTNRENIINEGLKAIKGGFHEKRIPELWDGNAADRIIDIIANSAMKR